jgi:hypothetical protein
MKRLHQRRLAALSILYLVTPGLARAARTGEQVWSAMPLPKRTSNRIITTSLMG